MTTLDGVKRTMKLWFARSIIIFIGMAPVSCHYELTAPALWKHQSSYAFEAWLALWIFSIIIAVVALKGAWDLE